MKFLCWLLAEICGLMHKLPNKQEERLQEWFTDIVGYHCPFALWSYRINQRYGLNIWKKEDK